MTPFCFVFFCNATVFSFFCGHKYDFFFVCCHELDWCATRFHCGNVYQNKRICNCNTTSVPFALEFWWTPSTITSSKHNLVMGYKIQSSWICIEAKINRPTSQRQNSKKCDNFHERFRQCVDNTESHLADLIFKT